MSLQGGGAVITAIVAGRSRRLATAKHWRAAIASGDLAPDSEVQYESAACSPHVRLAGDVPELRTLFAEMLPGFSDKPASQGPDPSNTSGTPIGRSETGTQPAQMPEAAERSEIEHVADRRSPQSAEGEAPTRTGAATPVPDSTGAERDKRAHPSSMIGILVLGALALLGLLYAVLGGPDLETEQPVELASPDPAPPAQETPMLTKPEATRALKEAPALPEIDDRREPKREQRRSPPATQPAQMPASPPAVIAPSPTQSVSQARRVQPRDLARWASRIGADYPTRARQRGEEGTVRFRVTVGPDGRVEACEVIASSGSSDLDKASCQGLRRYARFHPALNDAGEPIADTWTSTLTYRLN